MTYSTEYFVPSHDPILGIREQNIAPTIDRHNWQRKAIVAHDSNEPLYIYIAEGCIAKLGKKVFCATGYAINSKQERWRHAFTTPDEALSWINTRYR